MFFYCEKAVLFKSKCLVLSSSVVFQSIVDGFKNTLYRRLTRWTNKISEMESK